MLLQGAFVDRGFVILCHVILFMLCFMSVALPDPESSALLPYFIPVFRVLFCSTVHLLVLTQTVIKKQLIDYIIVPNRIFVIVLEKSLKVKGSTAWLMSTDDATKLKLEASAFQRFFCHSYHFTLI